MNIRKMYALAICFVFPIFGLYSVAGSFSWGHLYVVLFFLFSALTTHGYRGLALEISLLPVIFYTLLQTLLILLINQNLDMPSLLLKVLQWELFLVLLLIFNKSLFDWDTMLKMLRLAAMLSTGYLLLQQIVASVFGIYMCPGIPIFPYVREDLKNAYDGLRLWGGTYRPRSFFSEPALFCQFMCPALAIELFSGDKRKLSDYKFAALMILGIVISKSGAGFFALIFIWMEFVFHRLFVKRISPRAFAVCMVILPCLFIFALNNSNIQIVINRFTRSGNFLQGILRDDRFTGLLHIEYLEMDSWLDVLLGKGFTMEELQTQNYVFMGGILRHYYCFGLIGCALLAVLIARMYWKGNQMQRVLLLTFLFLCVAANPLHNSDLLVPFAFASVNLKEHGYKEIGCAKNRSAI